MSEDCKIRTKSTNLSNTIDSAHKTQNTLETAVMTTKHTKETHSQKEERLHNLEIQRNTNKSVLLMLVSGLCNTILVITVVPFIAVTMGVSGLIVIQAAMKVAGGVAGGVVEGYQRVV